MDPFVLKPAYKDYLWGGTRLKTGYGLEDGPTPLAESWELSAHPDGPSTVATGPFAGQTLEALFAARPELFGRRCRGADRLPILIKFIDAAQSLSVQVHPNDAWARRVEGEPGKTEMWVVLESAPGAFLYFGFEREISREEFERRIAEGTLTEVLHAAPVAPGDVFFIAAGTIHAIGAGIVLAEVQQNSNTTYRVFDFGRLGPDGQPRQLHVEKALEVTHLGPACPAAPGADLQARAVPGGTLQALAATEFFTVRRLTLDGRFEEAPGDGSFVSVLCCEGAATLEWPGGSLPAQKGGSLLVPAGLQSYALRGRGSFLLSSV